MVDARRAIEKLSPDRTILTQLGDEPTKDEIRTVVRQFKKEGLCGRRIAEQRLGPQFIASDSHGQREIELLDEVLEEEYADVDLCIRDRSDECSRLRGGCQGSE